MKKSIPNQLTSFLNNNFTSIDRIKSKIRIKPPKKKRKETKNDFKYTKECHPITPKTKSQLRTKHSAKRH